jgi:glycosyltransferase involved in cell wall biosynthesis
VIKEEKILFSIIIPTYNRANIIRQAIKSVLAQTYTNWELIIVDDGSTDNTKEIISSYSNNDNRIKSFFQINKGRSAARNKGIELSVGEYLCFLDDDDYYLINFLEEIYKTIRLNNFMSSVIVCNSFENQNDKIIPNKPIGYEANLELILKLYPGLLSFIFSKKTINTNRFNEQYDIGEDIDFIIRTVLPIKIDINSNYLSFINYHEGGTMFNEIKKLAFLSNRKNRLIVYNKLIADLEINLDPYILNLLRNKYNQIAYFYASACLKKFEFPLFLKYVKMIKIELNLQFFYYNISLLVRFPFYYIFYHLKVK